MEIKIKMHFPLYLPQQNKPDRKVMVKLLSRNIFITFLKIWLFIAAEWFKCYLNNLYSNTNEGQHKQHLQKRNTILVMH